MQQAITMVAVGKLNLADDNVRDPIGDSIADLAASIKSVGVLEPLIVHEEGLLVVCGSRRLAASIQAGLKEVPVILGTFTEVERLTVMAVENLQRQSLSPLEEARVFQRLSALNLTTREVAVKVGVSQSWVSKRMSLLKLPEVAQKAMSSGKIEISDAQELVKVAGDTKLVAQLVKKAEKGSQYTSLEVQRALEEKERAKEVSKAEAVLKKAGEKTVVTLKDDYYKAVPPDGMKLVQANGWGEVVKMDAAKHAKMKCHAVGVHPRNAETVEVCTDPGSHPDPELKRQAEDDKRRQQLAEEKERVRLESEHRLAFLRGRSTKVTEKQVIDVCFRALADESGYSYSDGQLALAILELDVEVEEGSELDEQEEYERKLMEMAKTHAGKLRVVFAFACDRLYGFGGVEAVLDDLGYKSPDPEIAKEVERVGT